MARRRIPKVVRIEVEGYADPTGPAQLNVRLSRERAEAVVVAKGYDADLDDARQLRDEGRKVISGLQAGYVKQTGIGALKIKHNNVLGYFIETTATHAEKMLSPPL